MMLPLLSLPEASAAVAIQELCEAMYRDELTYESGVCLLEGELRRFRARCPVASCRRVLERSPWVGGMRRLYCGCGWETKECELWHGVPR